MSRFKLRPARRFEKGQLHAAVRIDDDRFGAVEDRLVFRPAIGHEHGPYAGRLLEPIHHQRAAGEVFVLAGLVAHAARDEDDLGEFRVGRIGFERDAALLFGEFGAGAGVEEDEEEEKEEVGEFHAKRSWTTLP